MQCFRFIYIYIYTHFSTNLAQYTWTIMPVKSPTKHNNIYTTYTRVMGSLSNSSPIFIVEASAWITSIGNWRTWVKARSCWGKDTKKKKYVFFSYLNLHGSRKHEHLSDIWLEKMLILHSIYVTRQSAVTLILVSNCCSIIKLIQNLFFSFAFLKKL